MLLRFYNTLPFPKSCAVWLNQLYFISLYILQSFEKYTSCFNRSGSCIPLFNTTLDYLLGVRHFSRHCRYYDKTKCFSQDTFHLMAKQTINTEIHKYEDIQGMKPAMKTCQNNVRVAGGPTLLE